MSVLEVRRHAERGLTTPLSPRGEATARALHGTSYALVVSSPLERAMRTAELVGGRLDSIEPGLLPDIGGAQVRPKDRVLAISHGGIIELPIVALADELGVAVNGASFANLEGAQITYDKTKRTTLELLRVHLS